MLPRLNGKPVFLAINPYNSLPPVAGGSPGPRGRVQMPPQQHQQPPQGDQVAILVRLQKAPPTSKPVLLNVPRKVALKVKVGTTLSFSASNDHKYIVMDSKLHPPVGGGRARAPTAPKPRLPLPPSLSVIPNSGGRGRRGGGAPPVNRSLATFMNNKRPGLTITRGPSGGGGGPSRGAKVPRMANRALPPGSSVLSSGEV